MQVTTERPEKKITVFMVRDAWLRRTAGQRLVVRDRECRALALVVNSTAMAWTFAYRPRGTDPHTGRRWPNKTITLGTPGNLTPDEARSAANRLKGEIRAGVDPAAKRRAEAAAMVQARARTAGRALAAYREALPGRPSLRGGRPIGPRHAQNEISDVTAALAAAGVMDRPLAEIGQHDVRRLLAADTDRPSLARHRFGALSRFFEWCQEENWDDGNPCLLIPRSRRPKPLPAREHFLAPAHLARLWHAADTLLPVQRDLARFLIAVPCRRSEAARLDWSHVNIAAGTWTQPGKMTKNGTPHRFHLHGLALGILRARHEADGFPSRGLVFPGPRRGRPLANFSDIKEALCAASGLTGWQWHDIRRSFATALGEAGIDEAVADAVLNHRQSATRGGVLGVYQRARKWPAQVRAMRAWGRKLSDALHPKVAA